MTSQPTAQNEIDNLQKAIDHLIDDIKNEKFTGAALQNAVETLTVLREELESIKPLETMTKKMTSLTKTSPRKSISTSKLAALRDAELAERDACILKARALRNGNSISLTDAREIEDLEFDIDRHNIRAQLLWQLLNE